MGTAGSEMRLKRGMMMEFLEEDKKNQLCKMIVRCQGKSLEQSVDRTHITTYHAIAVTKGESFQVHELPGDGFSQICVLKLLIKQQVIEIYERDHGQRQYQSHSKAIMPTVHEEDPDDDGELLYCG